MGIDPKRNMGPFNALNKTRANRTANLGKKNYVNSFTGLNSNPNSPRTPNSLPNDPVSLLPNLYPVKDNFKPVNFNRGIINQNDMKFLLDPLHASTNTTRNNTKNPYNLTGFRPNDPTYKPYITQGLTKNQRKALVKEQRAAELANLSTALKPMRNMINASNALGLGSKPVAVQPKPVALNVQKPVKKWAPVIPGKLLRTRKARKYRKSRH
jgi:hypothetical protein